jgi:xylan 1,4-beta-xylosidase
MNRRADSEPGVTSGQQPGDPGAQVRDGDGPARLPDARADWERRIGQRLTGTAAIAPALPAPDGLTAQQGAGHIRLNWLPVPGAAGYLIERTHAGDGGPEIVRHGGSDVPAVIGPPFADTGLADGTTYYYRIAAVSGAELPAGAWSGPASGHTTGAPPEPVDISVDATAVTGQLARVWRMVGAERLSQLGVAGATPGSTGTTPIGAEFAEALRIAHADLGATTVRAHAILHDDNAVVSRDDHGSQHPPRYW